VAVFIVGRRIMDRLDLYHRLLTPMATTRGLVLALEKGLENGGFPPETRRAIYFAIDEQFDLLEEVGLKSFRDL
jgi:hypothetical protein